MTQLRRLQAMPQGQDLADLCASALEAVVDSLVRKTLRAAHAAHASTIVVAGGVSANKRLRQRLAEDCRAEGLQLSIPPMKLCTDNAAMIAGLGKFKLASLLAQHAHFEAFNLQPKPAWNLIEAISV